MKSTSAIRMPERSHGPAVIMAIGTANPPNQVEQSSYPDYYFRVTNNEHKQALKEKFRRICDKTMINRRYMHLTEEMLKENPSLCAYDEPNSLDARHDLLIPAVPKLGKEAAVKAIKEWGRPVSEITHLVCCSTGGVDMPGADYHLVKLLGLLPTVKRAMLYQTGCFAGGTVLRMAKDFAENNKAARVLVVCSELIALTNFRGPDDTHFDNLVGQTLFGDGAAALIVGADPLQSVEKALFEIASADQLILPDSHGAIEGHLREVGLTFHLLNKVPAIIANNLEENLLGALEPLGISDWNSVFWIVHPGGRAILDQIEAKLSLEPERLRASRHVLGEYGNMSSACVFFIMDEMRRRSVAEGRRTTGEGLDWGLLLGLGPGITMEMLVLRSVAA